VGEDRTERLPLDRVAEVVVHPSGEARLAIARHGVAMI
jgi:hypothetical protein